MSSANERPLVSFCVKSYRGRSYLETALQGAFAQTWRPLEIIVSDDASEDGSWELICALVARYLAREVDAHLSFHRLRVAADFQVILNCNVTNLGSLGNWERLCELSTGALIVKADGDDFSLPERTARLVAAWQADGCRALAICHSGWQMGRKGERKGPLRLVTAAWPLGAAMAFSPAIQKFFGRTPNGRLVDDELFTRRARMLGTVLELPDRLIHYRLGSGATTDEWHLRRLVEGCLRDSLASVRQAQCDLERNAARLDGERVAQLRQAFAAEARRLVAKARLVKGRSWAQRMRGFRAMGPSRALSIRRWLKLAFLMPRPLGGVMLMLYAVGRNTFRRLHGLLRCGQYRVKLSKTGRC